MTSTSVLTQIDCEEVVKVYLNNKTFKILNFSTERFSETVDGFLTDNILIKITVLTDGSERELRFFGKQFPDNKGRQDIIVDTGAFSNEIFLYKELLQKFKDALAPGYKIDFAPRFYFGKEKHLLVFEDLSVEGFTVPQRTDINRLDVEHIYLVMEALAKFHAGSIAYEEFKSREIGRKYRLIDEHGEYIREAFFGTDENYVTQRWSKSSLNVHLAFADLVPLDKISREEYKRKLRELAEKAYKIMTPNDEYKNAVCHGDLWAKNVLFKYDKNNVPIECKLIDFQLIRYLPPVHDALQFIFLTTDEQTRQGNFHNFLRHYYSHLRDELAIVNLDINEILPYKDFKTSVKYLLPQIKLQTAYYYSFQGAPGEFHKKLVADQALYMDFTFGNRIPYATHLFKTDERYRRLITKAVNELQELFAVPEVMKEDCYEIIKNKIGTSDYTLNAYSTESGSNEIHHDNNCFKLGIKLLYNGEERHLKMLAKSVSSINFDATFFNKEIQFHEAIVKAMNENTVTTINDCIVPVYFYRLNDVIIFDDLTSCGFKTVTDLYNYQILLAVVKKLAKLHASSLILEEKLSSLNDTTYRLSNHFKEALEENLFVEENDNKATKMISFGMEAIPYIIDDFCSWKSEEEKEDFKAKALKTCKLSYQLVKPSQNYRNVLCHGDLRSSSILIKEERGKIIDCRFTGFNSTRYLPPAHDLLLVLYLTTNRRVRSKYMEQLLKLYYIELKHILETEGLNADVVFPQETFFESISYVRPQVIVQSVINCQFTSATDYMTPYMANEEVVESLKVAKEEFLKSRRQFINKTCKISLVFKNKLHEAILDLEEICDLLY